MTTLYGTPPEPNHDARNRAGDVPPIVYARAAHFFPDETGRHTLSDDLLVEIARRLKRGDGPLDIVLLTDDAQRALVSRLPMGLALAAVVAEREGWSDNAPAGTNSPIAVVSGVPNLQKSVAENDLLIVDAHKARVLVEPDAEEFVRLQAERHRARVLLGAAHTPAQTQAGRAVPVWASVRSARDVSDALAWGADGIVVEAGGDLTGEIAYAASFEPDENNPFPDVPETMSLLSVVEAVGGGAVGLLLPFENLDPALVLSLASVSELRWAISPDDLPLPLPDLKAELAALKNEESETDIPQMTGAALPLFAALTNTIVGETAQNDLSAFDELWVAPGALDDATLGDVYALPPVRVLIGDALDMLPDALALGARGVVVAPQLIGVTKDMIRQQPN